VPPPPAASDQPVAFLSAQAPSLRQATATQSGCCRHSCLHVKSAVSLTAAPRSPPGQSLSGKSIQSGSAEGEGEGEGEREADLLAVRLAVSEALPEALTLTEREALRLAEPEAGSLRLPVALAVRLSAALGERVSERLSEAERETDALTLAAGEAVRAVCDVLPLPLPLRLPLPLPLPTREAEALTEALPDALRVALALALGVRLREARYWQQPRRAALQSVSTTAPPAALASTDRQAPAPAGAGARQSEALFAAK